MAATRKRFTADQIRHRSYARKEGKNAVWCIEQAIYYARESARSARLNLADMAKCEADASISLERQAYNAAKYAAHWAAYSLDE
jgi:hypothetical protein